MILKVLPFVLMAPCTLWFCMQIWEIRDVFWKVCGVFAMVVAFAMGVVMFLNTLVIA